MTLRTCLIIAAIAGGFGFAGGDVEAREIGRQGQLTASVDGDRYKCRQATIVTITAPSREVLLGARDDLAALAQTAGRNLGKECARLKRLNLKGVAGGQALRRKLGFALRRDDWRLQLNTAKPRLTREQREAQRKKAQEERRAQQEKARERVLAEQENARKREREQQEARRVAALKAAGVPLPGEPVGKPGNVAGVWQGQFTCGFSTVGVTLAIAPAGGQEVDARFKFYPLDQRDRRVRHGEFALRGAFDKQTGEVVLRPTKWINQAQGHRLMGLRGVIAADGTSIAGRLQDSQCGNVQITRIDLDPGAMPKPQTIGDFLAGAPETMAAAGTPEEKCAVWARWGSRFKTEYPNLNAMHVAIDQVMPKILNLYRDGIFRPFYGKTLAEITPDEAEGLRNLLRGCPNRVPATLRDELRQYFHSSLFAGPIVNIVMLSQGIQRPDIRPRVAALTAIRTWADRVLDSTGNLPANNASIEKLTTYLAKGDKDLKALFPSERKAFLATLEERRSALAAAMLRDTVADLDSLEASKASLAAIVGRTEKVNRYKEALIPAERSKLIAALERRRDAILTELITTRMKALETTGSGLEDVGRNAAWWVSFDKEYGGYRQTAPYRDARKAFMTQRNELLRRAQPRFEAALGALEPGPRTNRVAQMMMETLFPLDMDKTLPMYMTYRQLVDIRLEELKEEQERRRIAAEQERQRQIREAKLARDRAKFKGVHECDNLAGHPADPERTAAGVADDAINAEAAIEACLAAVEEHDKTPRFRFQLARALLRAEMYGEAVPLLDAAVEEEHAASAAYLGDMYQVGAGVKADWKKAMSLYKTALEGGFQPAAAALDAIRTAHARDIFDPKGYEEPMIVAGMYSGNFKSITYNPRFTRVYLGHMLTVMEVNCPVEVSPRLKGALDKTEMRRFTPDNMLKLFTEGMQTMGRVLNNPGLLVESEMVPKQAARDASILLRRHGCDSEVTKQFLANVETYVMR